MAAKERRHNPTAEKFARASEKGLTEIKCSHRLQPVRVKAEFISSQSGGHMTQHTSGSGTDRFSIQQPTIRNPPTYTSIHPLPVNARSSSGFRRGLEGFPSSQQEAGKHTDRLPVHHSTHTHTEVKPRQASHKQRCLSATWIHNLLTPRWLC